MLRLHLNLIFLITFSIPSLLIARSSSIDSDYKFSFTDMIDWLDASHQHLPELFIEATEYDINFDKIFVGARNAQSYLDGATVNSQASKQPLAQIEIFFENFVQETTNSGKHFEKPFLTLREVPPWLSILRGIVGVDCASQYTPFASMLPGEKTFFIYDESESLLGYLSLTKNIDFKFVLHDFAAPLISDKQIELSLIALEKYFGINNLYSVPANVLHENLNYKHIQKIIEKFILKDSTIQSTPIDYTIRDNFLNYMKSKTTYDFSYTQDNISKLSTTKSNLGSYTTINFTIKNWDIPNQFIGDSRSRVNLILLHLLNGLVSQASLNKLKEKLTKTISPQGNIDTQRYQEIGYLLMRKNQSLNLNSLLSPLQNPPKDFNSVDDLIQFINSWIREIADPYYFWLHHRSIIHEMVIAQTNLNIAYNPSTQYLVIEALDTFLIKRKLYKYLLNTNPFLFSKLPVISKWNGFNKLIISMLRRDPVLLETLEVFASQGVDILQAIGKEKRKLRRLESYIDTEQLYLPNVKAAIAKINKNDCGGSFL